MFQILFQAVSEVTDGQGVLRADITDVPFFRGETGYGFLALLITDDKTVFPAVGVKPFALLCSLKCGGFRDVDVKGKPQMMLAAPGFRHRPQGGAPWTGSSRNETSDRNGSSDSACLPAYCMFGKRQKPASF